METIEDLGLLTELVEASPAIYLRYSLGPVEDAAAPSRDYEASVELPGLPCTVLTPEPWWSRPAIDWVARRVCKYVHLAAQDGRRRPWILAGDVVAHGPDHEPLLAGIEPIAWLTPSLVEQAHEHYHAHFFVGRTSA